MAKGRKTGGRGKGTQNRKTSELTAELRAFWDGMLSDEEYREGLRRRVLDGKALPLEKYAHELIGGKPVERHEHDVSGDVVHVHEYFYTEDPAQVRKRG